MSGGQSVLNTDMGRLLARIGRVWRSHPKWSFGELMAAIGNEVGMSVDNMSDEEIYAVLVNWDHNGWGTYK